MTSVIASLSENITLWMLYGLTDTWYNKSLISISAVDPLR